MTKVRACTYIFQQQMPQDFIAWLTQKCYETYDYPWNSHDWHMAALVAALQVCEPILQQPLGWMQDCCLKFSEHPHELCDVVWDLHSLTPAGITRPNDCTIDLCLIWFFTSQSTILKLCRYFDISWYSYIASQDGVYYAKMIALPCSLSYLLWPNFKGET